MCQPQWIMSHSVLSPRWAIGTPLTENVSHPGAGNDQKSATTHPDLSRKKWNVFRLLINISPFSRDTLVGLYVMQDYKSYFLTNETFRSPCYKRLSLKMHQGFRETKRKFSNMFCSNDLSERTGIYGLGLILQIKLPKFIYLHENCPQFCDRWQRPVFVTKGDRRAFQQVWRLTGQSCFC